MFILQGALRIQTGENGSVEPKQKANTGGEIISTETQQRTLNLVYFKEDSAIMEMVIPIPCDTVKYLQGTTRLTASGCAADLFLF